MIVEAVDGQRVGAAAGQIEDDEALRAGLFAMRHAERLAERQQRYSDPAYRGDARAGESVDVNRGAADAYDFLDRRSG